MLGKIISEPGMNNSALNLFPVYCACNNKELWKWLWNDRITPVQVIIQKSMKKIGKSGSGWDIKQEDKPNVPSSFINFLNEVTSDYHEL